MSPLEAVSKWLASVDEAEQREIGFLLCFQIFDGNPPIANKDDPLNAVREWLTQPNSSKARTVGKAITFRACFEHTFAERYASDGWTKPQEFFRRIVDEASKDPESDAGKLAGHAFKMLRGAPERQALWKDIGQSWQQLVQDHLQHDALDRWQWQKPY